MTQPSYGNAKMLAGVAFDEAVARVTDALKKEGFGVLTEIDVRATMKKKLDVDMPPYKILGACNPTLANSALSEDPFIGLLLPCNVVVRETGKGVEVSAIDPKAMFSVVGSASAQPIADDAAARLDRVLSAL